MKRVIELYQQYAEPLENIHQQSAAAAMIAVLVEVEKAEAEGKKASTHLIELLESLPRK
ncbi:UNVERIFIED_CONTAM: hypothetical protein RF648_17600 [Kocuria sp. CPCC 205274]